MEIYNLKIVRRLIGGKWYKQTMSGELPNCYGSWWTKHPHSPHRYHYIERIQLFKKGCLFVDSDYLSEEKYYRKLFQSRMQ